MEYLSLVNKYTAITNEIGYIENVMKKDNDLKFKRKLSQLRKEQKELKEKIDDENKRNGTSKWN